MGGGVRTPSGHPRSAGLAHQVLYCDRSEPYYNRPSAHIMISMAASTKACASCAATVPGAYRMSVDQVLTRAKCGTTDRGILAPPFSTYRCSIQMQQPFIGVRPGTVKHPQDCRFLGLRHCGQNQRFEHSFHAV